MSNQNQDYRVHFAQTASTFRRRRLQLYFVAIPLVALSWYVRGTPLAFLTFLALFGVMIYGKFSLRKLTCPACELNMGGEFVRFCPECGSEKVETKADKFFLERPRCEACGAVLGRKKGERLYRIRFCTRCGAYLDEDGL